MYVVRVLQARSVSFVTERQGLVGQEATHHRRGYLKTAVPHFSSSRGRLSHPPLFSNPVTFWGLF